MSDVITATAKSLATKLAQAEAEREAAIAAVHAANARVAELQRLLLIATPHPLADADIHPSI